MEGINVERPLDLLNYCKDKKCLVKLKNVDKPIEVKLLAFDIHINLAVEKPKKEFVFIRGDVVETITPKGAK